MGYTAYKVKREELQVIPKHEKVFMHHITEEFGVPTGTLKPEAPKEVLVIGYASDDQGEALVVRVDGRDTNKGGKQYHITVSCIEGTGPVYSNKLIANGWEPITPYAINVDPMVVEW